jgi:hypothetical protein
MIQKAYLIFCHSIFLSPRSAAKRPRLPGADPNKAEGSRLKNCGYAAAG